MSSEDDRKGDKGQEDEATYDESNLVPNILGNQYFRATVLDMIDDGILDELIHKLISERLSDQIQDNDQTVNNLLDILARNSLVRSAIPSTNPVYDTLYRISDQLEQFFNISSVNGKPSRDGTPAAEEVKLSGDSKPSGNDKPSASITNYIYDNYDDDLQTEVLKKESIKMINRFMEIQIEEVEDCYHDDEFVYTFNVYIITNFDFFDKYYEPQLELPPSASSPRQKRKAEDVEDSEGQGELNEIDNYFRVRKEYAKIYIQNNIKNSIKMLKFQKEIANFVLRNSRYNKQFKSFDYKIREQLEPISFKDLRSSLVRQVGVHDSSDSGDGDGDEDGDGDVDGESNAKGLVKIVTNPGISPQKVSVTSIPTSATLQAESGKDTDESRGGPLSKKVTLGGNKKSIKQKKLMKHKTRKQKKSIKQKTRKRKIRKLKTRKN